MAPSGVAIDRKRCRAGRTAVAGRRLLAEAVQAAGAAEATLWLISDDGEALLGALNHGATPSILESARVPAAGSVVGMVAATGVAACIGPGDAHHEDVDRATGTRTVAMAATPVTIRGALVGVLSAINPTRGGTFSAEELDALQWKAYLLGLVLEDAPRALEHHAEH